MQFPAPNEIIYFIKDEVEIRYLQTYFCWKYRLPSQAQNRFWNRVAELEAHMEEIYTGCLPITCRLELRQLVDGLWLSSNENGEPTYDTVAIEDTVGALRRLKANLKRRATKRDGLTTDRLMELPDDARTILLSSIAFIFKDEVDEWSQIDFSNDAHIEMLKASVNSTLNKLTNPQGRPVNEALDVFFIGLRDLFEKLTGQPAIAGAHYNGKPHSDFEKLMYLGYQLIRPANPYASALKAWERAVERAR